MNIVKDHTSQFHDLKGLEGLIMIDALTNVPNYFYFEDFYKRKWANSARHQEPFSLIILDIDYLSKYNEEYGYHIADQMISEIASTIKAVLNRPEDFLARYEGGKFIVALPETNINGALIVAEKIRQKIEELRIPHHGVEQSAFVTVSLGVGTKTPRKGEDPFIFFNAVEIAMQTAKNEGKNQVIWSNVFI